ncbi:hypothetical protein MKW98_006922 [Papaver atlanticum]|uniref:AAA+ ATPase domain-containing protein n=1 Tax=Papaver atlanticum TaxID=357466 RepID=A0AAD4SUP3_9MAGN|nr:hypothetical protein MKW98_006922 [Papaver atlanticum]
MIDKLFSWTLKDIFNQHLYKDKVKTIPETFTSPEQYFNSFRYPLLEETRAELFSKMNNLTQSPTCAIKYLTEHNDFFMYNESIYTMIVEKKIKPEKEVYIPMGGDVIAFSDVKSTRVEDLTRLSYIPALVQEVEDEGKAYIVKILASKPLEFDEGSQKKFEHLFAVFLVNVATNCRIWRALNGGNLSIVEEVLDAAPLVGSDCPVCSQDAKCVRGKDLYEDLFSFNLNVSQHKAMLDSVLLSTCDHKNSVKLVWGPPGTGKTKTVATLLWALLKMKCNTLTCAPTNTAVVEVTSRLVKIVRQKLKHRSYGLGDIVLLGNADRMKIGVHEDLHEVFLDYRSDLLAKCFYPFTGWCNPYKMYQDYLRTEEKNQEDKEKCQQGQEDEVGLQESNQTGEGLTEKRTLEKEHVCQNEKLQFGEFFRKQFYEIRKAMKFCIYCICTHMPTSQLSDKVVKNMDRTLIWLRGIKSMLSTGMLTDGELKKVFSKYRTGDRTFRVSSTLSLRKDIKVFLQILRSLEEFAVPLQLADIQHAILIGDERQLPAMVQSKISKDAEFGRSLFGRLVSLGRKRHLLSVQYRMHPLISSFPNSEFYNNQISDASNVKEISYKRHLLEGNMFGPYSFINVSYGEEECNNNLSRRNMLEVAIISEIVENLFRASIKKAQTVKVGIISPYKAQVAALNEKLGDKYGANSGFSVIVRSVDGFQGRGMGVVDSKNSIRFCLWIVGNAPTLWKSNSVWKKLVTDATNRGCFFNAEEDERLCIAIINSLVELDQIDLVNMSSLLFKWSRWKVIYGENFVSSWLRIGNVETRKEIIAMLMKLSRGWRYRSQKQKKLEIVDGISSQLLEQNDIDGKLNILWTVDVQEEDSKCIQVLKFWDILPSTDIPELARYLDYIFGSYTVDTINRCKFKCLEGSLEVPKTWEIRRAVEQNYTNETNYNLSRKLASLSLGSKPITGDPRSRKQNSPPKQRWQPVVETIPETFSSIEHYFNSFRYPLLEEIRTEMYASIGNPSLSRTCSIFSVRKDRGHKPPENLLYGIAIDGKYLPHCNDVIALLDERPSTLENLRRPERFYVPAMVLGHEKKMMITPKFAVSLINLIPSLCIWEALKDGRNLNIMKEVLSSDSQDEGSCGMCSQQVDCLPEPDLCSFNLNESQLDAVLSSVATSKCDHKISIKLIWGPPGTGKTKTVSIILFELLKMKCKTLTCAPTNTAIVEVTSRLMKIIKGAPQHGSYGLGDIVLLGNKDRLKINEHDELSNVFLDKRIEVLSKCFTSFSNWGSWVGTMKSLLTDSYQQYHKYLENRKSTKTRKLACCLFCPKIDQTDKLEDEKLSIALRMGLYMRKKLRNLEKEMSYCIKCICTHMPTSVITVELMDSMHKALDLLNRNECLEILCSLAKISIRKFPNDAAIGKFCLQKASMIFCTTSSSARLSEIKKTKLVIIDEAAQLRECESGIPLQLPDVQNAILIDDEHQLPAMVQSKISEEAKFGRSLFERLVPLGHKRHLLDVQYRMHPSISLFPNAEFYDKKISDASSEICMALILIDISYGGEEFDNKHSRKNTTEVAVINEIIKNLFKASVANGQKVSVGIISPYNAQVIAVSEKLGDKYGTHCDFSVSVRSVDGFQGGEEDVIIMSTVRSNGNGSIGFLSDEHRTNIIGNGETLMNSDSVWRKIVLDAKDRRCYFKADDDKRLSEVIMDSLIEHGKFKDLRSMKSLLLKEARWKVTYGDEFWESFVRIKSVVTRKGVVALVKKLLSGWRDRRSRLENRQIVNGPSSQLLKWNHVNAHYKLLWTTDVIKDNSKYTQKQIPRLVKKLDIAFGRYSISKMSRCKVKCIEGTLEVPMSWEIDQDNKQEDCVELSTALASLRL